MNLAVLGAQWGDEGKGKIVDVLSHSFSVVARYAGGHNAGHTINLEEPDAFNAHLDDFFQMVDAGAWRNRDPRAMKDAILGR